jgi:nitrite reductase (NADH) large subunit
VFGDEPHPNYNRIMLSPVLAGEQTVEQIVLNSRDWYAEHGITLHTGKRVVKIDRKNRFVEADDGSSAPYDRLLLATGSKSFILPIPGADLPGVVGFRDIADVDAMIAAAGQYRNAVVIGGGLLGLEAANGLKLRGMEVSVVHIAPWLLERQMDEPASRLLQKSLEEKGLKFLLQKQTAELLPWCAVESKRSYGRRACRRCPLQGWRNHPRRSGGDGGRHPAQHALAESAGSAVRARTAGQRHPADLTDARIYAVGECVNHRGIAYGLVAPLWEQAKVCANHLAEHGVARYQGSMTSTKLKVTGIDLFSAGNFVGGEGHEEIVFQDAGRGSYKKLVLKDNKLAGAVLYGDTLDGAWYFELMRDATDVSDFRDKLLFGRHHIGDSGAGGGMGDEKSRVMALPDTAEICGCNGVCKGDIIKAMREKKLFTLDEVRAHTKASGSCGSCTGLVETMLAATAGGDYSTAPSKKPDGCTNAARRSTITCSAPGRRVRGRPASRFVNERMHANIQKDGSIRWCRACGAA